ncbi:MAG TPA: cytochrome c [Candidatus Angelobacter sp.]|jgi:mono/diheme cytochrome c family protein|nr:cytochrome c [Candidatus Angelobacter sp.]
MKPARPFTLALTVCIVLGMTTCTFAQDDAAALYKSKCQACHGADGKGDTAVGKKLGIKDFHSPEVAKMSDTELFEITKKGKEKMPAYDKKLTDDQIKSLIKFLHSLK